MGLTSEYSDTVEPIADVDAEAATNQHLFGVISGCGVTYDAANMTYDVAAGLILHNGSVVSVAAQANAGTLVADGTNPRWATIYLDSSGVEGLVSGTAAADPSKPETGDNVAIAMVLIEAGQTIANNISVKLDKRVWTHDPAPASYKYKTASQSWTNDTTFADVTATSGTLSFTAAASTDYIVQWDLGITATGVGIWKWQVTGPAAPTVVQMWSEFQNTGDGTVVSSGSGAPVTAFSTSTNTGVPGSTGVGRFKVFALIRNGSTAGSVTLQMAQNSASGTSTIGSGRMVVQRVGTAI